jgi:hypothetical protein
MIILESVKEHQQRLLTGLLIFLKLIRKGLILISLRGISKFDGKISIERRFCVGVVQVCKARLTFNIFLAGA